jgi:capsular polysaccharide biosynthesis protein
MSKTSQPSTIFLNTGKSFNKDEFVFTPLNKHGKCFKVIVKVSPNVIGIRFDPYEGYACIISNLKIITDGDKFDYTNINGEKLGNVLLFDNLDPQVAIDFNGRTFSKIKISGNIYKFNPDDVSILSKYRKAYKKHFDNRKLIKTIFDVFNLHLLCLKYLKMKYIKQIKNYTGRLYSPKQKFIRPPDIKVLFKKKIKLSYSPLRFDNDKSNSTIFESKIYTQYAVELENAMFFSCSNLIFFGGKVLYDLPFYDNEHRFRHSDIEVIGIKNKKVTFWKKHEEKVEKAIWMGGGASYNYYHLMYEFAIKFLLLNTINIPENIPVYTDQVCFDIPQFKELLDIMNIKKYPLIAASKDCSYMTKKLYYINCPHIMPPNYIDDNDIKFEDVQFDISGLKKLREYLLPYSSKKSFPEKIFISRKNASGLRKFNEDEVIELVTKFGFEVVYPEKLSIRDQIALFNQAKYIIGGSGAAFTNILFCNEQCKCIIFTKLTYPVSVFSTIAHVVGADLRYLTEETTKGKTKIESFHDPFEIDITYLRKQLFAWNFISE